MLKATGHYVLVEPKEVHEETVGGIILARETVESDMAHTVEGTLYDVGPNAWKGFDDGHPWAKVGEHVIYAKFAGKRVTDVATGKEYILMNDNDIICRVV